MTREVKEVDFRRPEFRDAKPEEYEFREDGELVRKDRWERGIRSVAISLRMSTRSFEIRDVLDTLDRLIEMARKEGIELPLPPLPEDPAETSQS
jgi:hypothetical protein